MRARLKLLLLMCISGTLVVLLIQGGKISSKSLSSNTNLSLFRQMFETEYKSLRLTRDLNDLTRSRTEVPLTHQSKNPHDHSMHEKLKFFEPTITREEQDIFRNLVKVFSEAIPQNMTYMMYSGTLLGSFRHNGMIPWDDDLDLLLKNSDKAIVKKSLERLKPHYQLCTKYSTTWKFYLQNGTIKSRYWTWPFLDLWFYEEDSTSIRNINKSWGKLIYKKSDTFPVVKRPFMGLMLPAPRYTERVLLQDFKNLTICKSNSYDHKNGKWKESVQVPCDFLSGKL